MKFVAVGIDLQEKRATIYGKGGNHFNFYCGKDMGDTSQLEVYLADFVEKNGYVNEGSALNKCREINRNIKFSERLFLNPPTRNSVVGSLTEQCGNLIKKCQSKTMYKERLAVIDEAKVFFKALEKDDDLDFSIEVPVNCSSIPNKSISFPRTIITVSDNRTHVVDKSRTNVLFFASYEKVNTTDFSHWHKSHYTVESDGTILAGMNNFADAWEDIIKPAVLAELEKIAEQEKEDFDLE